MQPTTSSAFRKLIKNASLCSLEVPVTHPTGCNDSFWLTITKKQAMEGLSNGLRVTQIDGFPGRVFLVK